MPAGNHRWPARVLQAAVLALCACLVLMQARSTGLRAPSGSPQHLSTQLCDGGRLHALLDGAARWAAVTWSMPDTHARVSTQRPTQLQHGQDNNSSSSPLDLAAMLAAAAQQQQEALTPATVVAAIELASRLVVGVACAVHSGLAANASTSAVNLRDLPLMRTLFPSFLRSAEPGYRYKLFLVHDHDDPLFSRPDVQGEVAAAFSTALAAEDARRWHPPDFRPGATVDPSTLMASLHWVACPYSGKPAWAQSDAAMAAFDDGRAEYVFRVNDDSQLPDGPWASSFIADLRGRQPVPNLGVVGPGCKEGNTAILTHDFVHRTHILIHGRYYPRAFPTWWADDFMTHVYAGYTQPRPLLVVRHDLPVVHRLVSQRYQVDAPPNITRVLAEEVHAGREAVERYALQKFGVELQR